MGAKEFWARLSVPLKDKWKAEDEADRLKAAHKIRPLNDDPRVFGYGRASTKKQADSPETQKDIIEKYAAMQGLGPVTWFVDPAKSGKTLWGEREAGRELIGLLRPGDHVIIAKLDRAFRRLTDCVAMLDYFQRLGIKLHVCNLLGGALDLSSAMGRFLVHILAAFAELERSFIAERTRDGIANKKRKGARHTRFPGYGMKWETRIIDGKATKIAVRDDDERKIMRAILTWRMQDEPLSWPEIAKHLTGNLGLRTRMGFAWDINRVKRACRAELQLQLAEQRGNR